MSDNPFPRWLIAILAGVLLVMPAGGYWFYQGQEQRVRQEAEEQLQAVAQLKVDQIAEWRADQVADATVLSKSPFLVEGLATWLADPQPAQTEQILTLFRAAQQYYRCEDVLLVDASGQIRLSLSGSSGLFDAEELQAVTDAFRERQPVLTDLHRRTGEPTPQMDTIVPLFGGGATDTKPIGALIFKLNPDLFLYPLIQSWPSPSDSAEMVIVRRDGDNVLFLNQLRHQPGDPLTLRIPLSRADLPAALAVRGIEGLVQGKDYRGVEVLAQLSAIPNSPWYMIAKMDVAEVLAGWRADVVQFMALYVGLAVAIVAAGGVIWQRSQAAHYQTLFETEKARRESDARFRILFENMLNGFAYCKMEFEEDRPQDFIYLDVNQAFETLTGLKDVVGKRVSEVIPGIRAADPELFEVYGRVARTGAPEQFETYVAALDMWFAISVYRPQPEHFVAVFDVITKRKQAEAEIHRLNAELEARVQDRTAQLETSRQELEAFAYSVSHDLRAPLRALDGFSAALLSLYDDQLDDQGRHYLNRIQASSRRMAQLINDLLDLSRVTRRAMSYQTVGLAALARETAAELQASAPQRRGSSSLLAT
jgi:signal transduction histidine kinase